jgi:hypothetical protein
MAFKLHQTDMNMSNPAVHKRSTVSKISGNTDSSYRHLQIELRELERKHSRLTTVRRKVTRPDLILTPAQLDTADEDNNELFKRKISLLTRGI